MSTPSLTTFDQLTIQQSFAAACGMTALHLVLEAFTPEQQLKLKEGIVAQWRASWQETFQRRMAQLMEAMSKTTNNQRLDQPEDYQQAFNAAMAEAEQVARISLRLDT